MEDKRVKLNELKSQTVRAIIDYTNEDGSKKQIEIYNIIGDRRQYVLDKLNQLAKDIEENGVGEYVTEDYYLDLIMEFTDVKADETSINEILTSPRFEFTAMRKILDDMVFEIQYEDLVAKMAINRQAILQGMVEQIEMENALYEEGVKKQQERIKKNLGDEKHGIPKFRRGSKFYKNGYRTKYARMRHRN